MPKRRCVLAGYAAALATLAPAMAQTSDLMGQMVIPGVSDNNTPEHDRATYIVRLKA